MSLKFGSTDVSFETSVETDRRVAFSFSSSYVFDVETSDAGAVTFGNRKLFAYADT